MECSNCGVSGDKSPLFDVISGSGIVKLCGSCMNRVDVPVLRRPTTFQLKESEKTDKIPRELTRGEKISQISSQVRRRPFLDKQNVSLRDIVERNFHSTISSSKKAMPELIDNFNWIILRERRARHLTCSQVAKEMGESESAIKMAEDKILPDDGYKLIRKLESYYGLSLVKKEFDDKVPKITSKRLIKFDNEFAKNLTIDDLKKMKASGKEESEKEVVCAKLDIEDDLDLIEESSGVRGKTELDQDEIDKILFRGQ